MNGIVIVSFIQTAEKTYVGKSMIFLINICDGLFQIGVFYDAMDMGMISLYEGTFVQVFFQPMRRSQVLSVIVKAINT